jgi:hypothetical protein
MRFVFALLVLPATLLAGQNGPSNELLDQYLKKGIDIPGLGPVKLPVPLVRKGMKPAELDEVLDKARERVPLNLFLKNNVYAPHNLTIQSIDDPEAKKDARRAQSIKLTFVAYGKLKTVIEKDMLTQLIGGGKNKVDTLTDKQLKERGIEVKTITKDFEERYSQMELELLDTILVSGITRNIRTSDENSAHMTTLLDPRFAKDKEFPNRWQPISQKGELGKAEPYSGLGGYVFALDLPKPAGALYLEMHFVLHEPYAWFDGKNLLRSKLPLVIEKNVRDFRRKLAKAG